MSQNQFQFDPGIILPARHSVLELSMALWQVFRLSLKTKRVTGIHTSSVRSQRDKNEPQTVRDAAQKVFSRSLLHAQNLEQ